MVSYFKSAVLNKTTRFTIGWAFVALAALLIFAPRDVAAQPVFDGASNGADTIINLPFLGADNVFTLDVVTSPGFTRIVSNSGTLDFPNPTNSLTINLADNPNNSFNYITLDAGFLPPAGVTINGGTGADNIDTTMGVTPHTLNGGDGPDSLTGSPFIDTLNGGPGNDMINGGPGADMIDGGANDDTIVVGLETAFQDAGNDTIEGGADNDCVRIFGDPILFPGGEDVYVVSQAAGRVNVIRLNGPNYTSDIGTVEKVEIQTRGGNDQIVSNDLTGVANLNQLEFHGGSNDDTLNASVLPSGVLTTVILNGESGNGVASSTPGNDDIFGSQGADTILGGDGNDDLQGNGGNDIVDGGPGPLDVIRWNNGDGNDVIDGCGGAGDLLIVSTGSGADDLDVSPNGARFTVSRSNLTPFTLDVGAIETLVINSGFANDDVTVNDLSGVSDLTNISVTGDVGDDIIRVDHSPTVAVSANGNEPAVAPGDTFHYLGSGVVPGTAPNGTYTEGGQQDIIAQNFETFIASPNDTGIFRVDPVNGADSNNGAEWAAIPGVGPKRTIQHAIDCADALGGGQIWLRQGLYKPTLTRSVNCDDGVGTITQVAIVMADDVCVIGGFTGTETSVDEKSMDPKLTIIDGSCADGGGPANHVVTFVNVSSATLECLTVQGGVADELGIGSVNDDGGGIYIRCADETNRIFKVVVQCNEAINAGGGIAYFSNGIAPASVEVEQSVINNNVAMTGGGGIYLDGILVAPFIHESFITGNFGRDIGGGGIVVSSSAEPLFINDVISGNSARFGGGVLTNSVTMLTMYHCDINHNTAESGGGVGFRFSPGTVIRNSTIVSNMPNGIEEDLPISNPDEIAFNLFFDNMGVDYVDADTGPLFGAGPINALGDIITDGNVDTDPLFIMDGPDAITGDLEFVNFNPTSCTVTLVDNDASFTPGDLRCEHVMIRGASKRQYLIIDNTETEIVIAFCKTPNAQTPLIAPTDTYVIVNYDLRLGSGAIDLASMDPGPSNDILGRFRPIDIPGLGFGARRNSVTLSDDSFDIGAFEHPGDPLFVELTSLSATSNGGSTTIAWETSAEVDNVGFNVYRSDADGNTGKQVNGFIILAEGSETEGASYSITDGAGASHYVLEDIDVNGVRTIHGPVAVLAAAGASGDVNGDGFVNQIDAILLYRSVMNGDDVGDEGDVNGDGVVNVLDAIALYRSAVGAE